MRRRIAATQGRSLSFAVALALVAVAAPGCKHSKHARVTGYTSPPLPAGFAEQSGGGWRIAVPTTWKPRSTPAAWAVYDPQAVDDFHANVNVVTEHLHGELVPLRQGQRDGPAPRVAHQRGGHPGGRRGRRSDARPRVGLGADASLRRGLSHDAGSALVEGDGLRRDLLRLVERIRALPHHLRVRAPFVRRRALDSHPVKTALFHLAGAAALATTLGCAGLPLTPIKAPSRSRATSPSTSRWRRQQGEPVGGLAAERFAFMKMAARLACTRANRPSSTRRSRPPLHAAARRHERERGRLGQPGRRRGGGDHVHRSRGEVAEGGDLRLRREPGAHRIVPFTESTGSTKAGVQRLSSFKPQDPSTNLNGAVVHGLDELDRALAHSEHPLRFGTLVVFTDGTDHAARVPAEEMQKKVRETRYDVFAIGLGAEIKESQLRRLARAAPPWPRTRTRWSRRSTTMGARIEAKTKSYYLLSYCSPARAGKHEVRIEADARWARRRDGIAAERLRRHGLRPGCDPNTPPKFDVTKGDALAPPPPEDHGKDSRRTTRAPGRPRSPRRGRRSPRLPRRRSPRPLRRPLLPRRPRRSRRPRRRPPLRTSIPGEPVRRRPRRRP